MYARTGRMRPDSELQRCISEEPALKSSHSVDHSESKTTGAMSQDEGEMTSVTETETAHEEQRYLIQNPFLRNVVKVASCGMISTVRLFLRRT